jgi:hypothetical protein
MAGNAKSAPRGAYVRARLTYTVDTGVKPVTGTTDPDGRLRHRIGEFAEHEMVIHDGRTLGDGPSLEREGFVLAPHDTAVDDFYDEEELRSVYYPEIHELIRGLTGASRVIIFDHTIRSGDEGVQESLRLREPVKVVHNDYTEWSGPQRLRDLLPEAEAEALLRHRLAVIQVWRPIRGPVLSSPLAICDARSVAEADLIPAERRHPDRVGEIYQLAYNPDHRWFYFPEMQRDEALVFKCYDSETDGRARFTAHGSFDDPDCPAGAPPRESIEIRTLALFESNATDPH